jgi:hypothetical protein
VAAGDGERRGLCLLQPKQKSEKHSFISSSAGLDGELRWEPVWVPSGVRQGRKAAAKEKIGQWPERHSGKDTGFLVVFL